MDVVMDLYDYTTTIIANENIFNRTYSSLINRIDQEVSIIYHYCRSANEDYDNRKKDEAEIRIKMEEEAIKQCKWLKTDIRLAQRKFHLRAKKTIYWNGLANNALVSIRAWRTSEIRNYKEKFGL